MTAGYRLSGNCRTIKNWANQDRGSTHLLIVTRQDHDDFPEWLSTPFESSGGGVVILPVTAPPLTRARWIREIVRAFSPDLIVSHHCPHDAVVVAAFAPPPGGPPFALVNQADHVYWVGGAVADTVVNLRPVGEQVSISRRGVRHNSRLDPLPTCQVPITRSEARRAVGVAESCPMLVSVGRAIKYIPSAKHNFYKTAKRILDSNAEAHLFLIGASESEAIRQYGRPTHRDFIARARSKTRRSTRPPLIST